MAELAPSPVCLPVQNAVADVHLPPDGSASPLAADTLHRTAYLEPSYNSKLSTIDHVTPGVGCESPVKKLLRSIAFVVSRALRIHGGFNPVALNASPLIVPQPYSVPPSMAQCHPQQNVGPRLSRRRRHIRRRSRRRLAPSRRTGRPVSVITSTNVLAKPHSTRMIWNTMRLTSRNSTTI